MTPVEFILQNRPYFEDFITRSVYHSNAIEENAMPHLKTVKGLGRNYAWKERYGME